MDDLLHFVQSGKPTDYFVVGLVAVFVTILIWLNVAGRRKQAERVAPDYEPSPGDPTSLSPAGPKVLIIIAACFIAFVLGALGIPVGGVIGVLLVLLLIATVYQLLGYRKRATKIAPDKDVPLNDRELLIPVAKAHVMTNSEPQESWDEIHSAVWMVPSGTLLLAILPLPIEFYTLVRLVVCSAVGFLAYRQYRADRDAASKWSVTLCVIALLYNPLVPVYLGRGLWVVMDIIVVLLLMYHWGGVKKSSS